MPNRVVLSRTLRRLRSWSIVAAAFVGCSLDDSADSASDCVVGPNCVGGRSDAGQHIITPDNNGNTNSVEDILNELCGAGTCSPDRTDQCEDFVEPTNEVPELPPTPYWDAGLGAPLDGAVGDAAAPPPMDASAPMDGGEGKDPLLIGDAGALQPRPGACRLVLDEGKVQRACGAAGYGEAGSPCTSSRDCASGHGCVGAQNAGQCLPFCCAGEDACDVGRYCAERPLRVEGTQTEDAPLVPVCARADNCGLDEPYPCPEGETCTCGSGLACTVVRSDGTTGCRAPGEGTAGEECPCAPGFFCSKATATCLKICRADHEDCGAGKCQTTQAFPEGWGVCVGAPTESMSK